MTTTEQRNAGATSGAAPTPVRDHLRSLTGLRLFAAIAVYFSHIASPAGAPDWLRSLQETGYAGVTFFFVLSGFVLTLNYFDRLTTRQQIWSYTVARLARVYPLYLVCLSWPAAQLWAAGVLPKRELLEHVLGLQAWDSDVMVAFGFVGPAWSISVELFLYATLPLLLPLIRLIDRRTWLVLASMAAVIAVLFAVAFAFVSVGRGALPLTDPASAHRWLYRTPLLRVGDFVIGILAARIYVRLRGSQTGSRLGQWLIPAALGLTVLAASRLQLVNTAWSYDALYAVPAAALVLGLALAPRNVVSRLLSLRAIVFLGEASFAFYLAHVTVAHLLGSGTAWATAVTPQSLVVEALDLGLAIVVAVGLHVGIERPARIAVRNLLDRPRTARRHEAADAGRWNSAPHDHRSSGQHPETAPMPKQGPAAHSGAPTVQVGLQARQAADALVHGRSQMESAQLR